MPEYLFSYGTLQKESVQLELFGRKLHGENDVLKGYVISEIEVTDMNFLSKGEDVRQKTLVHTKNANDFVSGTVFEISESELSHADKYEPNNYNRVSVVLASGRQAWVYMQ